MDQHPTHGHGKQQTVQNLHEGVQHWHSQQEALSSNHIIHYYHPKCPHSQRFAPKVQSAADAAGIQLVAVNCARVPRLCEEHQVQEIPQITFMAGDASFFHQASAVGFKDEQDLTEWLEMQMSAQQKADDDRPIVQLTASNFHAHTHKDAWLVYFHQGVNCDRACIAARTAFERVQSHLSPTEKFKTAAVNCYSSQSQKQLCEQEGIVRQSAGAMRPFAVYFNSKRHILTVPESPPDFQALDADEDGNISFEEWQAAGEMWRQVAWQSAIQGAFSVLPVGVAASYGEAPAHSDL